jgi:hypothetical protein
VEKKKEKKRHINLHTTKHQRRSVSTRATSGRSWSSEGRLADLYLEKKEKKKRKKRKNIKNKRPGVSAMGEGRRKGRDKDKSELSILFECFIYEYKKMQIYICIYATNLTINLFHEGKKKKVKHDINIMKNFYVSYFFFYLHFLSYVVHIISLYSYSVSIS